LADLNKINDLWLRKENFINTKLKTLEKDVKAMADGLLKQLVSDYLGRFDTDSGRLVNNTRNMSLVNQLEREFEKFTKVSAALNRQYGKDMLRSSAYSEAYYEAFPGVAQKTVRSLTRNLGYVEQLIGLEGNKIIPGSFLDTLTDMPEVRERVKQFVLSNVSGNNSYSAYLRGMKDLLTGSGELEGAVEKYYRQYAYDTFNNVDAAVNKHYAEGVGFRYFIYHGSIIDTTRAFCRKKAGKVFSVTEANRKWPKDPDLIGNAAGYVPLIERGRYNCRHSIKYISDELAYQLRPELKKRR